MPKHAHGDPRRPDGDLVTGVEPQDRRGETAPGAFGPKVGWGHDAVYRPPTTDEGPPTTDDGQRTGDDGRATTDDGRPASDDG